MRPLGDVLRKDPESQDTLLDAEQAVSMGALNSKGETPRTTRKVWKWMLAGFVGVVLLVGVTGGTMLWLKDSESFFQYELSQSPSLMYHGHGLKTLQQRQSQKGMLFS